MSSHARQLNASVAPNVEEMRIVSKADDDWGEFVGWDWAFCPIYGGYVWAY